MYLIATKAAQGIHFHSSSFQDCFHSIHRCLSMFLQQKMLCCVNCPHHQSYENTWNAEEARVTLLKSCMCPCLATSKWPPRQTRGTKLKCGMKGLQKGSGKANSLRKWRGKKSFKEESLQKKKLASKPRQSSWSKEGEMLPHLEGRIGSILFLQHNLHDLFNTSLCLLGVKETFPGNASFSSASLDRLPPSPKQLALNSSQQNPTHPGKMLQKGSMFELPEAASPCRHEEKGILTHRSNAEYVTSTLIYLGKEEQVPSMKFWEWT